MNETKKAILIAIVAIMGFLVGVVWTAVHQPQSFGAAENTFTANQMVNTTSTCGAVSAIIVGSSSARDVFYAWNEGTNTVTLCEAGSCISGAGAQLVQNASGTQLGQFSVPGTQPYWGPISCIVGAGSTTIGLMYNQ